MKSKVAILAMALALVGVSHAQAASITINEVAGTTYYTNGFTDFSVSTGRMNGMLVTAYWILGGVAQGPQTAAWNNGVTFTGTDFDLAVTGDTYDNDAWQLDFNINSAFGQLQRLVFDGSPATPCSIERLAAGLVTRVPLAPTTVRTSLASITTAPAALAPIAFSEPRATSRQPT